MLNNTNRIQLHQLHQSAEDSQVAELEAQIQHLRMLLRSQADLISELQCRADPYSQDGEPICDSFWRKEGSPG